MKKETTNYQDMRETGTNLYMIDEKDLEIGRMLNTDSSDYIYSQQNNIGRTHAPDYSDFDYVDIKGSSADVDQQQKMKHEQHLQTQQKKNTEEQHRFQQFHHQQPNQQHHNQQYHHQTHSQRHHQSQLPVTMQQQQHQRQSNHQQVSRKPSQGSLFINNSPSSTEQSVPGFSASDDFFTTVVDAMPSSSRHNIASGFGESETDFIPSNPAYDRSKRSKLGTTHFSKTTFDRRELNSHVDRW